MGSDNKTEVAVLTLRRLALASLFFKTTLSVRISQNAVRDNLE